MQIEKIIFGKNPTQRITNIEVSDNQCEVFTIEEGDEYPYVHSQFVPNKFWVLFNENVDNNCIKLRGNLYYKYGKQFSNREEFMKYRGWKRNKDQFSIYNPEEAIMCKDGLALFKGLKHTEVDLMSLDIETTGLNHDKDSKVICISTTYRYLNNKVTRLFSFDEYSTEAEMLLDFVQYVQKMNPSILLGHNIFSFDLPYLEFIAKKHDITLDLGRDGSPMKIESNYEKKFRFDGARDLHYHDIKIYGRSIVDTMFLAVRADIGRKYGSYGIKAIMKQEGWEAEGRVYYDASQIRFKYMIPEELEKIKAYCQFDGDDVIVLWDKFIPPFFYMSQSIPKPFQLFMQSASGSQLNALMIRAYLQDAFSLPKHSEPIQFEGAISLGNPGIYSNVNKLDVASLYPSIMKQYAIGPVGKDPNKFFTSIVDYFRTERLKNKDLAKTTKEEYYSHLEQSQKIVINSLYGFLGAPGLLFNDPYAAAEVTRYGREILKQALSWAETKGFIIANADTDSIAFGKKDGAFFTKEERLELQKEINTLYPENITWDQDGFYPRFIVMKAKNYIMQTEEGKVKYKGSALKSPMLEPALREFLDKTLNAILKGETNYTEIYNGYVEELLNNPSIERWATRKTISEKTLNSTRANETKIKDAIEDTEYVEGDRIWVYTTVDKKLALISNYKNDLDLGTYLKKLYQTCKRFETIIDVKEHYINYSLVKNKKLLELE